VNPALHHDALTEALREELALYAFGLLDHDQGAAIARHLDSGCAVCNEELRAVANVCISLAASADPVEPPPELKDRVLTRFRTEHRSGREEPAPGLYIIRDGTGEWKPTPWQGITWKRLYLDKSTGLATSLLGVAPGARYPAHRHHGVEQSWVVEGSCRIGAASIYAGDFACAAAGTEHDVLVSEEGCVLLIVSTARDEILA